MVVHVCICNFKMISTELLQLFTTIFIAGVHRMV